MKQIKLAKEYPVPEQRCPNCGKVNDTVSGLVELGIKGNPEIKPESGDLSICINCGYFSIFADDLSLREMTEEEKYKWAGDPTLLSVSEALAKAKKRN
jgi:hypothetical protein